MFGGPPIVFPGWIAILHTAFATIVREQQKRERGMNYRLTERVDYTALDGTRGSLFPAAGALVNQAWLLQHAGAAWIEGALAAGVLVPAAHVPTPSEAEAATILLGPELSQAEYLPRPGPRRLRRVILHGRMLLEVMTRGVPFPLRVAKNGLPEGCTLIGTVTDWASLAVYLFVEHPSFDEVDEYAVVPLHPDVLFEEIRANEAGHL